MLAVPVSYCEPGFINQNLDLYKSHINVVYVVPVFK